MSTAPTVLARSVRKIADSVASHDKARHLLRAVGLDHEAIDDPLLRIPSADMMLMFELAARMTKDAAFGLHVGERFDQRSYGIVGHSVITSATLGEGLRSLVRYLPIWTNVGEFKLEVENSVAHFQWRYANCSLPEPRHDCETSLATVVHFNRLSKIDWNPREVWFQHKKPKDVSEHARIFRAPVRFGMPTTALLLDSRLLALPLESADPVAHQVITEAADQLLAAECSEASCSQTVLSFIRQRLSSGEFSLDHAALHLGMSRRSLQRKLSQESSSHRILVQRARRDLSRYLLLGMQTTATEAAYHLGFSEPSAFQHAFHKWHGTPPQAYRREQNR